MNFYLTADEIKDVIKTKYCGYCLTKRLIYRAKTSSVTCEQCGESWDMGEFTQWDATPFRGRILEALGEDPDLDILSFRRLERSKPEIAAKIQTYMEANGY